MLLYLATYYYTIHYHSLISFKIKYCQHIEINEFLSAVQIRQLNKTLACDYNTTSCLYTSTIHTCTYRPAYTPPLVSLLLLSSHPRPARERPGVWSPNHRHDNGTTHCMHLNTISTVLQLVIYTDGLTRQLPGLTSRHKSNAQLHGNRRAQYEAASLHT